MIFGLSLKLNAQDSLLRAKQEQIDSVLSFKDRTLDSLSQGFKRKLDSINSQTVLAMKSTQIIVDRLNHTRDSLSKLSLPTSRVTGHIDSLKVVQDRIKAAGRSKVEQTRKETSQRLGSLQLPPGSESEVNRLAGGILTYIPSGNMMPRIDAGSLGIPSGIPANTSYSPNIPNKELQIKIPSIQSYQTKLQAQLKEANAIKSKANLGELEKIGTSKLSGVKEVSSLKGGQEKMDEMTKELAKAKELDAGSSVKEATAQVDHFKGQGDKLKASMGSVSQYKQKYKSLKSIYEIPKQKRNELKGAPWIERFVPGLNFFVQNNGHVLVDLNPYAGWRFNQHLMLSLGWNERIGIEHGHVGTKPTERFYGPRASASYFWKHGFTFRLVPELMSAYTPYPSNTNSPSQTEDGSRNWQWGIFAGIRKDFKIYRSVHGYSEILYNFLRYPGHNVYGDVVSFRLGIELNFKKKIKGGAQISEKDYKELSKKVPKQ